MCGIFCGINCGISTNDRLVEVLKRRGPDFINFLKLIKDNVSLEFAASVLWQQGENLCPQPLETPNFITIFNGDIFNITDKSPESSDTEWLTKQISECDDESSICHLIESLEGPFSVIFYNKSTHLLYVCRDSLGRNSLLIEKEAEMFRFLSTSYNFENGVVTELPPLGLYAIDVTSVTNWKLFPWKQRSDVLFDELKKLNDIFGITVLIEDYVKPNSLSNNVEPKKSFDLFDICRNLDTSTPPPELFETLLKNQNILYELQQFSILLEGSVKNRVCQTPQYCINCLRDRRDCNHAKVAVLFSGGIDCSILAILSHKYVNENDAIDLINVAFEKVGSSSESDWDVPDRLSAKASLSELKQLFPQRRWNYVEVNVSREELNHNLQNHIKHLIYPLNTVLDESIGCAFWFASRGNGLVLQKEYISPARVVLVGSGADELFGGYTRHRNAFCRFKGTEAEKLENLHRELEKDWNRIWARNLGRDDRVVADNGKTLRAPFIEEHLVENIRRFSPSQLCCFLLKEGIGDKLFLRLYGFQLGLKTASYLKKRAIQFGSRIANKKQNAADRSVYL
ncbi:asparagine synthetase domain-containing protein CG17486 [Ceratitis capitata]|uniref:asparagine synthetase domain-containing protein CG17486 n=1 Tax=Ceratitis capitata TaxID=7213 RepID=UPI00032A0DB6|nr:asparagine synthetase domain-containing protein CG17486 [Ceratitis capitata]